MCWYSSEISVCERLTMDCVITVVRLLIEYVCNWSWLYLSMQMSAIVWPRRFTASRV